MTFISSCSSKKSVWSSSSAEWLRQRDAIVIESHKKNIQKLSFNSSPESKHTATCNGADELAFGNLGRCLGSL
jgi:hypothetical protein